MSNCSASEERELKEQCGGCCEGLGRTDLTPSSVKNFFPCQLRELPEDGSPPWPLFVVALAQDKLPDQRRNFLPAMEQCGCIRAWSPRPNSKLGIWKECNQKMGDKDVCARYVDRSLQTVAGCEDSSAPNKSSPPQQKWIIWFILLISVTFPQLLLSLPARLMKGGHGSRDGGIHGHSNVGIHSPRLPWL